MKNFAELIEWDKFVTFTDWHVPDPSPAFVRARVSGFVGCVGCSLMAISGSALEWYYSYPRYFAHLEIFPNFQNPNSNMYQLDRVFDKSTSYLRRDGIIIDAIFWLNLVFIPSEQLYRIHVFADVAYDPDVTADIAPLPGYWNPIVVFP